MFIRRVHIFRRLNNLIDFLVTCVIFMLIYLLRNHLAQIHFLVDLSYVLPFRHYAPLMLIAAILWPIFLNYYGLYTPSRLRKGFVNVGIIVKSSVMATFLLFAIVYLFQIETISRLFLGGFGLANALILILKDWGRRRYGYYRRIKGKDLRWILILGTYETAKRTLRKIEEEQHLGLKPVGIVLPRPMEGPKEINGVPLLGTVEKWRQILHEYPVSNVLVTVYREYPKEIETALWICQEEGVECWLFALSLGLNLPKMELDHFADNPIFLFRTAPVLSWAYVVKLLVDRLFSLALLLLLSPLLLLITLLIAISSGRPVLYRQTRAGRFCQPFELYKFRTLGFREKKPPLFGSWLRHVGLDELPQLINILKGEMSFVGPRPHVPEEVNRYEEHWQRRRFSVPPGLTCYRQILREGKVSFDEEIGLDLKYIDKWSFWLDIFLIYKTALLLLRRIFYKNGKIPPSLEGRG